MDHRIIIFEKSATSVCSFCDKMPGGRDAAVPRFSSADESPDPIPRLCLRMAPAVDCRMLFVKLE